MTEPVAEPVTDPVPAVVALVGDLMDRSRISAAVPSVRFAATPDELAAAVTGSGAGTVALVDLSRPGSIDDVAPLVAARYRVVGFVAHVDADLADRARGVGIEVHPRSRLFRSLGAIVAGPTRR